jgi:hypothetical protein
MHRLAFAAKLAVFGIIDAIAHANFRVGGAGRRRRAAQKRADAQQQLAWLERLGQIVVGAEFKSLDAIFGVALRGQDQDRHLRVAA